VPARAQRRRLKPPRSSHHGARARARGTITFDAPPDGREPYRIARLGVGYVPDERLIFPDLTVRENLEIA